MAEQNQVQQVMKEPQQVTTKEPQQVTMKDPKKVEASRRLAAHNHKKRELKAQSKVQSGGVNQYYEIGAVIAVRVIGGLGYYIYQTNKGASTANHRAGSKDQQGEASGEVNMPHNSTVSQQPRPQSNKFEMN